MASSHICMRMYVHAHVHSKHTTVHQLENFAPTGHTDMQMDSAMETDGPGELIPNESDFLLGYATVPGFVSYRSKTRGSWYVTKLTELLNKYAYE